ncbi:glycosyltransferase family 2 protein [Actinoplanes sp. KI2]|uniref:glycosyltransferase family 2 protein n=1 Tax=Actinoplanes sp. KI2 TaxID=2983315 RepID=UPI0021D59AFB|nr:glycosyltransferase family 2 protein [Actinoplanes sp. KI2]MCU7725057.1 glycosyltransferase family 2 protein [Actinoplanes sp. KI2]
MSVVIAARDPGGLSPMLRGLPPVDEVIVVSEGPSTETAAAVRAARPDARVLRPGRTGLGNALATGLAASTCDVVITLNGDGSTDPGEIPAYVAALTGGADVALGSRYRDGGRDLTGGRLGRRGDAVLVWILNRLFGTERTDPGFGYAAFWRDALDVLDLPDPSARSAATWADGPELGPLLALRSWLRGLTVTEIGSVAGPRASRADLPTPAGWWRVIATELRVRRGRYPVAAPGLPGIAGWTRAAGYALQGRAGSTRADGSGARPATHAGFTAVSGLTAVAAAGEGPTDPAVSAGWSRFDRRPEGEPLWGPGRRRPSPARDLWQAGDGRRPSTLGKPSTTGNLWRAGENRLPNTTSGPTPHTIANVTPHAWGAGHSGLADGPDVQPSSADKPWRYPVPDAEGSRAAIPPQREVGAKRRRIESRRERPDLRVINGGGDGTGSTRSGFLRPVPRENLGN